MNEGTGAFLGGSGIPAGIRVIILAFDDKIFTNGIEQTYIFMGGVAVLWNSITSLKNTFKPPKRI